MATYEFILTEFFAHLYPRSFSSFEAFEAEPGLEDRQKTRHVLEEMRNENVAAAKRIFDIDLDRSVASLALIDRLITPRRAEAWMKESDPNELGNFFKVTVSEFGVYFGDILLREFGGGWRYSRMPNWTASTVTIGEIAFHVFDSVIKKCSDDFGHETLASKYNQFASIIANSRTAKSDLAPN